MTMKGFTLIETLIAITILTLAVAGPLTTASQALTAAQVSKGQLTASYLAQEGIEYVRFMRDDEYLKFYPSGVGAGTAAWNEFLNGSAPASITSCRAGTCMLDPAAPSMCTGAAGNGCSLIPCSGGTCTPLYLANNIYTEQSGISGAVVTPFKRTIQAFTVSATDERIVSTVSWTFHNLPYSVIITDHLTPWE